MDREQQIERVMKVPVEFYGPHYNTPSRSCAERIVDALAGWRRATGALFDVKAERDRYRKALEEIATARNLTGEIARRALSTEQKVPGMAAMANDREGGAMSEQTQPDCWEVWVCPVHGVRPDDGDFIEGQNPAQATSDDPDGWTGVLYCGYGTRIGGEPCYEEVRQIVVVPEQKEER
jgi:hypothetical protein